ncbi:allantoate amidohydrolase [Microbacterium caowuchunii]|uniref:Allantoate amidohydrolase n=1 Tax=Microbacterium caowuchunii TaxID=2614638 RepID=A0A5J6KUD0_9MICO|nr:allantoate amidohydrolase [Microbacterium caowuchunii]KAA9134561.1 allantoate amidohydrolase [Microbacterium caowuchunii]QEV98728.1 allantoate amidohydrolase [Microbacterium caowuchunii]
MTVLLEVAPDRIAAAARRVMARCEELARVSAAPDGIERVYLSPEHARVNRLAAEWMRELGMRTRQDAAGNQVGRLDRIEGDRLSPDAPTLMIGSHLDTVPDAGRFDGIVGVLMGLEVARLLRTPVGDGRHGSALPFAIEVVAFSDEEGTRFGKALLGSSAVAGLWDEDWWALTDAGGTTLRQAFLEFGLDPARIGEAARRPDELVGYLEAHIEQGPELDRRGEALAVVSSIASARRFQLVVEGEARHAGGTPYDMRRDALLGASEAALAVERICQAEHHIIGTVGQLEAFPGAVNIVPGEARFSLDLRGEFDGHRDDVWDAISHELDAIMGRRGLRWHSREVHDAAAVMCAPLLQDVVRQGITSTRATGSEDPAVIFSRAGHDAMSIGAITDVGMLFLRNPDGISHHRDESVSGADVALGIRALAESVLHLAADRRA